VTSAYAADRFGADKPWGSSRHKKRCVAADGTGLYYEVVGRGEQVLLLANGLGGRLYAWEPLLDALHADYRLVTWDYRGLFDSDTPARRRRLSVFDHAHDGLAILDAERIDRAVLVGWSMGVQVSLEMAASFPERCAGLVLLNGTYGHALETGFQPLFSVPWLPKRLHQAAEFIRDRPALSSTLARLVRLGEVPTTALFTVTAGERARRLQPMLRRYFDDVLGPSFENFMRLFQELDAHGAYHLLPEIDAPALIVSGALDLLTPMRQSIEMQRRLRDARHLGLLRASHFALLERPEVVVPEIQRFLEQRARW
jgi:pimeloyl-ACP methyl ester carboxylesterase